MGRKVWVYIQPRRSSFSTSSPVYGPPLLDVLVRCAQQLSQKGQWESQKYKFAESTAHRTAAPKIGDHKSKFGLGSVNNRDCSCRPLRGTYSPLTLRFCVFIQTMTLVNLIFQFFRGLLWL